jgi:hypothetical protein
LFARQSIFWIRIGMKDNKGLGEPLVSLVGEGREGKEMKRCNLPFYI